MDDLAEELIATATYTDGHGSGKTAEGRSGTTNRVVVDNRNRAPAYDDLDTETEGRQTDQTREVEENTDAGCACGVLWLRPTIPIAVTF